jgi:hypothetical protein
LAKKEGKSRWYYRVRKKQDLRKAGEMLDKGRGGKCVRKVSGGGEVRERGDLLFNFILVMYINRRFNDWCICKSWLCIERRCVFEASRESSHICEEIFME